GIGFRATDRVVATTIIDEEDLVRPLELLQNGLPTGKVSGQPFGLVANWNCDAQWGAGNRRFVVGVRHRISRSSAAFASERAAFRGIRRPDRSCSGRARVYPTRRVGAIRRHIPGASQCNAYPAARPKHLDSPIPEKY